MAPRVDRDIAAAMGVAVNSPEFFRLKDDIEILVTGLFGDRRTFDVSGEDYNKLLRGLRYRHEDRYYSLFSREQALNDFITQIHTDSVAWRSIDERALTPNTFEYLSATSSGGVSESRFTSFKSAADDSLIDEILNSMFGLYYPKLRYLKRYFILFGWTDSSFLPLLSALPRSCIPDLIGEVRANSSLVFEGPEIEELTKGINSFLDRYNE